MKFYERALALYFVFICLNLALMFVQFRRMNQQHRNNSSYFHTYSTQVENILPTVNYYSSSQNILYFTRNMFGISSEETKSRTEQKIILFYNEPIYMKGYARKDTVYENCDYKNCIISRDKRKLLTADAVIFYIGIRNERMGKDPPINAKQRNPNQAWIFTSVEPPEHYYNTDYKSISWHNMMNWSSLYRLDSDIPNPYGCLIRSEELRSQDYISTYNAKTRNALWIVSHCQVASARRQYVSEMIRNGFNVDILGGCGSDGHTLSMQEVEQIIPTYKYFLAFENSFCCDYISEKFFQNYNSSLILVVRGGSNYNHLLPKNTYINTADFLNITFLVSYLSNLANDRDRYIEFLRNKDKYVSIRWPGNRNCEICRRLNNLPKYIKSYPTLAKYLTDDQCFRPIDL